MSDLPTREQLVSAHGYITTSSGRRVVVSAMRPVDVDLRDIVDATSNLCRWNGHVRRFFSVAEHLVTTCRIAEVRYGVLSEVARCALLHDASEAYMADIPSPVKAALPDYKRLEKEVEDVIWSTLGLPPRTDPVWLAVKVCDELALHYEASVLLAHRPDWVIDPPPDVLRAREIACLSPGAVRIVFLQTLQRFGFRIPFRDE